MAAPRFEGERRCNLLGDLSFVGDAGGVEGGVVQGLLLFFLPAGLEARLSVLVLELDDREGILPRCLNRGAENLSRWSLSSDTNGFVSDDRTSLVLVVVAVMVGALVINI